MSCYYVTLRSRYVSLWLKFLFYILSSLAEYVIQLTSGKTSWNNLTFVCFTEWRTLARICWLTCRKFSSTNLRFSDSCRTWMGRALKIVYNRSLFSFCSLKFKMKSFFIVLFFVVFVYVCVCVCVCVSYKFGGRLSHWEKVTMITKWSNWAPVSDIAMEEKHLLTVTQGWVISNDCLKNQYQSNYSDQSQQEQTAWWTNHAELLAITRNLLKTREKPRLRGAIGFGFASHWLKNVYEIFKPFENCSIPFEFMYISFLHFTLFICFRTRGANRRQAWRQVSKSSLLELCWRLFKNSSLSLSHLCLKTEAGVIISIADQCSSLSLLPLLFRACHFSKRLLFAHNILLLNCNSCFK